MKASRQNGTTPAQQKYISPKELALRWCCSRSTVDRIAERERLTRLCLGDGQNGVIRYLCEEVETLESDRTLPPS